MKQSHHKTYKVADTLEEIEQIHHLNYKTFVNEIPQHDVNDEQKLVDRFHNENTYIVAKVGSEVIGMIAVRGRRPFSLDEKLNGLDTYLPADAHPCEIRLLAVIPEYRGRTVFYGLCERLVEYCLEAGYTMALISGTPRQEKLYKHIGFLTFGPRVGTEQAPYQPMYLTKENFERSARVFKRFMERHRKTKQHCFLPGPVTVSEEVKNAAEEHVISHRSFDFKEMMGTVQQQLCDLTGARHVVVAVGTGTLANDMIAARLSEQTGKGLILANGEFGERLIDHAYRWRLDFSVVQKPWNTRITRENIEEALQNEPAISWVWTVHCETSTGYLYDLEMLSEVCKANDIKLCVDACSSVGIVPVDFKDVYLASSVSGKGLGAYPGLAIIFSHETLTPSKTVPRYLDIGLYQADGSVPFTHSSNHLAALRQALENSRPSVCMLARHIVGIFNEAGIKVLGNSSYSPGIITAVLPEAISVRTFGDRLKAQGILVSYESSYLLERNWFQVALMGAQEQDAVIRAGGLIAEEFEQQKKRSGGTP